MQDAAGSATPSHPALHPYDPKYSLKAVSPPLPTQTPKQQQRQAQGNDESSNWQYDKGCWEAFHARDNATARFYKERRSPAAHGAMKHSCSVALAAFVCTSRLSTGLILSDLHLCCSRRAVLQLEGLLLWGLAASPSWAAVTAKLGKVQV